MNKKLLNLAVGAALVAAAPAFADTANVNVYGVLNTTLESVKAEGATTTPDTNDIPMRQRITSNSSRVGFKGDAATSGPKVIFQFETGINSDRGAWSTTGRDTFVGFTGDAGELKLGRLTAPSKTLADDLDFHDGNTGFASSAGIINRWHLGALGNVGQRISDAVGYQSPKLGNVVTLRALYGTDENKTNENAANSIDDKTYQLSATFELGGLYVGAAYSDFSDPQGLGTFTFGGNTYDPSKWDGKLTDTRVGVKYKIANVVTVGALWDRASATGHVSKGGLEGDAKRTAYHLPVEVLLGDHRIVAQYTKASKLEAGGTDIDGSEATMVSLGYYYSLSKATTLRAYYAKITNKDQAKYDYDTGGLTPATGADPTGIALGIRHNF